MDIKETDTHIRVTCPCGNTVPDWASYYSMLLKVHTCSLECTGKFIQEKLQQEEENQQQAKLQFAE